MYFRGFCFVRCFLKTAKCCAWYWLNGSWWPPDRAGPGGHSFSLKPFILCERLWTYSFANSPHLPNPSQVHFLTLFPPSFFRLLINGLYSHHPPPLEQWWCPCSCVNFCSSFLFPPCPAPTPCCTELLSPGVHRLSYLRTSSLSSAHSDSRPNSPFRHHFIPYVKGKGAGFPRQHPAEWRCISTLGRLIRRISERSWSCGPLSMPACAVTPPSSVLELA